MSSAFEGFFPRLLWVHWHIGMYTIFGFAIAMEHDKASIRNGDIFKIKKPTMWGPDSQVGEHNFNNYGLWYL